MSQKNADTVHRNSSGGIDGYVTDEGYFMWGNPALRAEEARRRALLMDAATKPAERGPEKSKDMDS